MSALEAFIASNSAAGMLLASTCLVKALYPYFDRWLTHREGNLLSRVATALASDWKVQVKGSFEAGQRSRSGSYIRTELEIEAPRPVHSQNACEEGCHDGQAERQA